MEFNKKLMHLRKLNGWSQEELADKLNVSRQTISNWELGDTSPDAKKLIQISKLFDTSVNELLGTNNSKNKSNIGKYIKIAIIASILLVIVLYCFSCIYKFSIIFKINNKFESYKEIDNYSYKTLYCTQFENKIDNVKENEYLYANNTSKITVKTSGKVDSIFYTDYNNNYAIAINEINKTFSSLDINKMPNAKSLIYSLNPAVVYCRNSLVDMLLLSIRPTLKISSNDDNYIVKYKDFTIWINKESALPERSQFYDEQTHENIYRYHEFIFNQTTIDDLQVVNYDNYLEI